MDYMIVFIGIIFVIIAIISVMVKRGQSSETGSRVWKPEQKTEGKEPLYRFSDTEIPDPWRQIERGGTEEQ
jgi:hypothetical protein